MDQYIGRLLDDRYEILEIIGTGGMAVVYKARDHRLNRLVAVKILKDEFARDEEFRRRFRAEGEAACAAIRTETDAEIDRQLDEARQAQQAKAEHTLHFETERARTRANRELSAARMQARAKLAAQRQQIAADAFAAARTQLAAFAAGRDYAAWLVKSAAALAETMGESGTLYARTADLPLLQGKLPAGVALAADDTITLGGLRAANPATGLAADDTLEARLDAQHDWFLQNAGLEITI
mgnify:CR=1 FL=1